MLTSQKFAQLAGTTRRTLIFYDQKGLFQPKHVAENGYRYYDYDQLYELTFILELRRLGLSIAEIQQLNNDKQAKSLDADLKAVLAKIDDQIDNLSLLKTTLQTRFDQAVPTETVAKNQPFVPSGSAAQFCGSRGSGACREGAVADSYAEVYAQLGKLKLVNQQDSGFLTQLPKSEANDYPTASFCILKAVDARTDTGDLPLLQKPAGKYVSIDTTNDMKNICISLQILAEYIQKEQLKINDQLWQMNLDEQFTSKGASDLVRLQYQLQTV